MHVIQILKTSPINHMSSVSFLENRTAIVVLYILFFLVKKTAIVMNMSWADVC
jgi:hypothetical protein